MHSSGCGCREQITIAEPCGCGNGATTPLVVSDCRQPLQPTEIAPLVYVYGLDAANCRKYQSIASVLGLLACDGSPVTSATPLVTCTLFNDTLCSALAALTPGGLATTATELVGADCLIYTLPPSAVATPLTVLDTSTVDLTLTLANVLSADVIVSPDAGNTLVANANGLFVPTPPSAITVADTPCIDLDLTGGVVTATPILSADDCNALSCSLDGLLVLESTSSGLMTEEVVQLDQPVLVGSVLDLGLITLDIENPSSCRSAILSIHLQTPSICTVSVDPVQTRFDLLLQRNLAPVYSEAEFVLTSTSFNSANDSDASYDRGWVYTVPPGFTGSITVRVRVTQITGSPSNITVVSPVLRYHLSTI